MLDKMTNGYLKVGDIKDIPDIIEDMKLKYRDMCLKEYGVAVKVKVKLEPYNEPPYTHRYKIRCKQLSN